MEKLKQVKPAHYLEYDINSKKKHMNIGSLKKEKYIKEIRDEFEFLIKDSLKLRLHDKIRFYYSGGVDSSL